MKFTQQALLFHKAEFEFGDKMLTYRIEDEKARAGMTILYESISTDKSLQSYREKSPAYLALILLGAALIGFISHPAHGPHEGSYILAWVLTVLGWACLITARYTKFDSTSSSARRSARSSSLTAKASSRSSTRFSAAAAPSSAANISPSIS